MVNLLSRSPYADTIFLGFAGTCPLKEGFTTYCTPAGNCCEINSENIFCVTEMSFPRNNSQTIFHAILSITKEYL